MRTAARVLWPVLLLSACALSHERATDGGPPVDAGPSPLVACPAGTFMAGTMRDCGWQSAGTFPCTPGRSVAVGCAAGCGGLGSCTSDSMIRVCQGDRPCLFAAELASNDDSGCDGVCSLVPSVVCPASGQLFVLTAPFSDGQPYTCNVAVR